MHPEFYTVQDMKEIFGVSYWTVLRWARKGEFGAYKVGKWRFPKIMVDVIKKREMVDD